MNKTFYLCNFLVSKDLPNTVFLFNFLPYILYNMLLAFSLCKAVTIFNTNIYLIYIFISVESAHPGGGAETTNADDD